MKLTSLWAMAFALAIVIIPCDAKAYTMELGNDSKGATFTSTERIRFKEIRKNVVLKSIDQPSPVQHFALLNPGEGTHPDIFIYVVNQLYGKK